MEMILVKAIVRPILDDGRLTGYEFLRGQKIPLGEKVNYIKECALTRAFADAIDAGRMTPEDLVQVAFVDEEGNKVVTTDKALDAYSAFWEHFPQLHAFGTSQNMAQNGKFMASTMPIKEALAALWGEQFADRVDLHKYFKLSQIAYQPGRLRGDVEQPPTQDGKVKRTAPIGEFVVNALVDEKRDDEDGIIFVRPDYWDELLAAYSTPEKSIPKNTTLIKVNSMTATATIKGVLMKTDPELWERMITERAPQLQGDLYTSDDVQIILCGNAIKDTVTLEPGYVYELDQTFFAYHDDSSKQRGTRVNASKQLQTRSGWDNHHFVSMTCAPVFKTLQGLLHYDEETVLRVIGAVNEDGEETGLENDQAVKTRILQHHLPANHPTNATQILRRGLSYIKDHLSKIEVPGFHGMGAPSHVDQPGVVLVPEGTYRKWLRQWGTNAAYLFRMPYLGSYCGRFVTLAPYATDTIHVHWQDALQMEGDFDGDNYYVIPSAYVKRCAEGVKPDRPGKKAKDVIELTQEGVDRGIVELSTSKTGIGNRDNLLSVGFDWLHYWYNEIDRLGEERRLAQEREAEPDELEQLRLLEAEAYGKAYTWERNIEQLQIYVQQAIEGLKHGTEGMLTDEDIAQMFNNDTSPHPYTSLMAKANFNPARMSIQGTRTQPGYLELVRQAIKPSHYYHPLHPIFVELAKLELGKVCDVLPYWDAIKVQRTRAIARQNISVLYGALRRLHRMYAAAVARWNGGKNKNMAFGRDVLEPVRAAWASVLALAEDYPERKAMIQRDLCLMLANVAYEPQPNWEMVGTDEVRGLGVFTRMKRFPKRMRLLIHGEGRFVRVARRNDHKPLCDGIVVQKVNRHRYATRLWLPRPGSLFHHLVTPEMAVDILRDALPKIDFDKLMADALKREFVSAE